MGTNTLVTFGVIVCIAAAQALICYDCFEYIFGDTPTFCKRRSGCGTCYSIVTRISGADVKLYSCLEVCPDVNTYGGTCCFTEDCNRPRRLGSTTTTTARPTLPPEGLTCYDCVVYTGRVQPTSCTELKTACLVCYSVEVESAWGTMMLYNCLSSCPMDSGKCCYTNFCNRPIPVVTTPALPDSTTTPTPLPPPTPTSIDPSTNTRAPFTCYECFTTNPTAGQSTTCNTERAGCRVCYTRTMTTSWSTSIAQGCEGTCPTDADKVSPEYNSTTQCCHSERCNALSTTPTTTPPGTLTCYSCDRALSPQETFQECQQFRSGCQVCYTRTRRSTQYTHITQGCDSDCRMNTTSSCCYNDGCNTWDLQAIQTTTASLVCYNCSMEHDPNQALPTCDKFEAGCAACFITTYVTGPQQVLVKQGCAASCVEQTTLSGMEIKCCYGILCNYYIVRTVPTVPITNTTTLAPTTLGPTFLCYDCSYTRYRGVNVTCTTIADRCSVCSTRMNSTLLYDTIEQSCAAVCVPESSGNSSSSCCRADLCNDVPIRDTTQRPASTTTRLRTTTRRPTTKAFSTTTGQTFRCYVCVSNVRYGSSRVTCTNTTTGCALCSIWILRTGGYGYIVQSCVSACVTQSYGNTSTTCCFGDLCNDVPSFITASTPSAPTTKAPTIAPPTCSGGTVWSTCASACAKTCANPNPICTDQCVSRCACPLDKPILNNSFCITLSQCPSATCSGGTVWSTCASACDQTCANPNPICTNQCVSRCACPLDKAILNNSFCITLSQCPSVGISLPWTCNFESPDICQMRQGTSDNYDWSRNSGSTETFGTGPDSAQSGAWYVYTEVNGLNLGDSAVLESPMIRYSGDVCVGFYLHMSGNTVGTFLVYSASSGRDNSAFAVSGDNGPNWTRREATVTVRNNNDRIVFLGTAGSDIQGDISLDNIDIRPGACSANTPPELTCFVCTKTLYPGQQTQNCTRLDNDCGVCYTMTTKNPSYTSVVQGCATTCPADTATTTVSAGSTLSVTCCSTDSCNFIPPNTPTIKCYSCSQVVYPGQTARKCDSFNYDCKVCYTLTAENPSYTYIVQGCGSSCIADTTTQSAGSNVSCCSSDGCNALTIAPKTYTCYVCSSDTTPQCAVNTFNGLSVRKQSNCGKCKMETLAVNGRAVTNRSCLSVGALCWPSQTACCCSRDYCNDDTCGASRWHPTFLLAAGLLVQQMLGRLSAG